MTPSRRRQLAFAVAAGVILLIVTLVAWLINTTDWGIALVVVGPFIVYGIIRFARKAEGWANQTPFD
jgi:uncharacterized membrane protein